MDKESMATKTTERSGFHTSDSDSEPHSTIQRDNSAPSGTEGNNVGHVYGDGSAKASNGGSIRWTLD